MSIFGGGGGGHPKPDKPPTPAPVVPTIGQQDAHIKRQMKVEYRNFAGRSYTRYLLNPSGDVKPAKPSSSYAAGIFSGA